MADVGVKKRSGLRKLPLSKMPFTPLHFSAHAVIAFPLNKKINIIVFIVSNAIIDIEPLLVIVFNYPFPLHGYAHTFIGAGIIGGIWGIVAYQFKTIFEKILGILKLPSAFSRKQYFASGVFGALLHVVFDSPLYLDIKPFFPLNTNPLYGLVSNPQMYIICSLLFIPAMLLYFRYAKGHKNS